ncbi:hypothetical protein ACWF0M_22705 [Kribbella sp. NPDC055110]
MSKQRWTAADAASMQSADGGSRTASTLAAQQQRVRSSTVGIAGSGSTGYRLSRGGAGTAVPR